MEENVTNESSEMISIKLNNFLHRIDCKATIIKLTDHHCCTLKRIRRSRNWLLVGHKDQLVKLSNKLQQDKTVWIAQVIEKALPKPTLNLTFIAQSNPAMSVNQLMAETGCSLLEARSAIDEAEGFI